MPESPSLPLNLPHVLVADPPWLAKDQLPGGGRGAAKHYPPMTVDEICAFDVGAMHDDAWLFLWRVSWLPAEPLQVCEAWGFAPKSEIVWLKRDPGGKTRLGMGHYVRNVHETCIIAARGKACPLRLSAAIPSTFEAAPPMYHGTKKLIHSAKPEKFFDLVECLVQGPYRELFARRRRPDWDCRGAQVDAGRLERTPTGSVRRGSAHGI